MPLRRGHGLASLLCRYSEEQTSVTHPWIPAHLPLPTSPTSPTSSCLSHPHLSALAHICILSTLTAHKDTWLISREVLYCLLGQQMILCSKMCRVNVQSMLGSRCHYENTMYGVYALFRQPWILAYFIYHCLLVLFISLLVERILKHWKKILNKYYKSKIFSKEFSTIVFSFFSFSHHFSYELI